MNAAIRCSVSGGAGVVDDHRQVRARFHGKGREVQLQQARLRMFEPLAAIAPAGHVVSERAGNTLLEAGVDVRVMRVLPGAGARLRR